MFNPLGQSVENDNEMINYLAEGLDSVLHDRPAVGILLAGDFKKLSLGRLCNRFNLKKIVNQPTRRKNKSDQILTNMANLYSHMFNTPNFLTIPLLHL